MARFMHAVSSLFQVPEIQRTPLDSLIIQLIKLNVGDISQFFSECLSKPSDECVSLFMRELQQMGAITPSLSLTSLGHHLALLPVEPTIGKFILYGSIFSCLDPVLTIAACFSHKDPFVVPLDKEEQVKRVKKSFCPELSDPLIYVNAVAGYEQAVSNGYEGNFCWRNFLSLPTLKFILEMKQQFADYLFSENFISDKNYKKLECNRYSNCDMVVKAMVVAGFYPSIIKVDTFGKRSKYIPLFSAYRRVDVHLKSCAHDVQIREFKYLVNYMRVKGIGGVFLHDVSPAHPYALMLFGSDFKKGAF